MVSSTHPYARRNTTRGHPVRFDIQLVGRCRCALPGRASICCARALDMAVSSGPTQWDAHSHCTGTGRQAGGGTDSGGHVRARCDATRLAGINVGGHLDSHCKPTVNGEPTFDASSTHSTRPRRARRRDSAVPSDGAVVAASRVDALGPRGVDTEDVRAESSDGDSARRHELCGSGQR